ncbi:hypothetical protein [Streptomyces ureilyticus]|uniref:Uncharacterized protein n=1 Tax=Streptomyces ureilyticus TaxID=1775131 RepID=A0ABX0E103_9ACTN|nr:hypothetical protein [Streptomyces ureilyticus]NGO44897.1 hypothetical protein [Streptomyces ureilyticus]
MRVYSLAPRHRTYVPTLGATKTGEERRRTQKNGEGRGDEERGATTMTIAKRRAFRTDRLLREDAGTEADHDDD